MPEKDSTPWFERKNHFVDYGGGGQRSVRKVRGGNYVFGICPSCKSRRAVSLLAWHRASKPVCMACGQYLEPSDQGQKDNPDITTRAPRERNEFCVFCNCKLNPANRSTGYCSSKICAQLDKIAEELGANRGMGNLLIHTVRLEKNDKLVWWEGTIRTSRKTLPHRYIVKMDYSKDKWSWVDETYLSAREDLPNLKSGDRPTLGNYLKMALMAFGEKSRAVAYLEELIGEAMYGDGELVVESENEMLSKLGKMHFRNTRYV